MAETEPSDPQALRAELLERWERAASGWGRRAPHLRGFGMPVSAWMIEHAGLQPGQRVLELAAGPGETGLLAAELIRPGGMLISSDASENMLELARGAPANSGSTTSSSSGSSSSGSTCPRQAST